VAAAFGGSVSALQCMCSVDRVIHYTVVALCGTRPASQKAGRCLVCTKALCPRRHDCNGSVNRAWCMHGHPPLGANEKIRWSETEVERKIAEANGGSESTA